MLGVGRSTLYGYLAEDDADGKKTQPWNRRRRLEDVAVRRATVMHKGQQFCTFHFV